MILFAIAMATQPYAENQAEVYYAHFKEKYST